MKSIVIHFLSFKEITRAYLLKILIKHNKKRLRLLNLLISSISVRFAPQILSIKGEFMFLFLVFLIIVLCNSSASSLLDIFSNLNGPPNIIRISSSTSSGITKKEIKDIVKVNRCFENRGILLKETTQKLLVQKMDFSIFIGH